MARADATPDLAARTGGLSGGYAPRQGGAVSPEVHVGSMTSTATSYASPEPGPTLYGHHVSPVPGGSVLLPSTAYSPWVTYCSTTSGP